MLVWLLARGMAFAETPTRPAELEDSSAGNSPTAMRMERRNSEEQLWNWHVQNTAIVQYHPRFSAKYSGTKSLPEYNEVKETVSLDLMAGARLWQGAEVHVDGLMWQGFGLGDARGINSFPNGEAFRLGTEAPNLTFARVFLRQTIGLGGETEVLNDDQLQLRSTVDVSRVTLTVGKLSAKDIFDGNTYANDPRTQFMNWGLMANLAWDYPADALGYITGMAAELNQPDWAVRYGFFQVPSAANGIGLDTHYLEAWGMVAELEHRHALWGHRGAVRLLGYVNRAHMGSYQAALDNPVRPADIVATRAYRHKFGFGLNVEQEVTRYLGAFMRLGWSDGRTESWSFNDADRAASAGLSAKGDWWGRPGDTFGVGGVVSSLSHAHHEFFGEGGLGILVGDGKITYRMEKVVETYYDWQIWKNLHGALDYQFISDPAFNRDRGPVSVFGARLHWEF